MFGCRNAESVPASKIDLAKIRGIVLFCLKVKAMRIQ